MQKLSKIIKIIGIVAGVCFITVIFVIFILYKLWMIDSKETINDVSLYEDILGEDGRYKNNLIGYNDIFPQKLPESAEIETFYYEYYNPWDPNYLGYLVYTCDDSDLQKEFERLHKIKSSANLFIYGATGFPYELCAAYADEYYGYIYALIDRESNKFIYIDLEFCNFFTNIDYESIIDRRYLPFDFDAASGNASESLRMDKMKKKGRINQ